MPGYGRLRNVSISDLTATGADKMGCSITGLPGHPVEGVALENIRIAFAGGGTETDADRPVPEHAQKYPKYKMFGILPACGLYCRHARGLRLSNVQVGCLTAEERPSLVCDEVEELELCGWRASAAPKTMPVIRLVEVRDAWIHGCRSPRGAAAFLGVQGRGSGNIRLIGNDLSGAVQAVELDADVSAKAVHSGAEGES